MSDNYFYYSNKYLQSAITKMLVDDKFDMVNGQLTPKTYEYQKMPTSDSTITSWACLEPFLMNPKLAVIFNRFGLGPFDAPCRIVQVNGRGNYAHIEVGRNNSALIVNLSKTYIACDILKPNFDYINSKRATSILNIANLDQFSVSDHIEMHQEHMTIVDYSKYKIFSSNNLSTFLYINFKYMNLQDMKKLLLTPG
jgi:hypothetical protein